MLSFPILLKGKSVGRYNLKILIILVPFTSLTELVLTQLAHFGKQVATVKP